MRAVDTGVLVCAHRAELPQHRAARAVLEELITSGRPWALPWPCVYEFLRVVTHPKVLRPPTPTWIAWENMLALMAASGAVLLAPTERHPEVLARLMGDQTLKGNDLLDARIAALVIEHGARALITADRRFRRFDGITIENPFA